MGAAMPQSTAPAPPKRRRGDRSGREPRTGNPTPPGEDAGGGGGGDDGRSERGETGGDGEADRARLGLFLALVGMTTLFGAFLIAALLLRRSAAVWPPPGAPVPPRGLWVSTLVILASSGTFVLAVRAGEAGSHGDLRRWLGATLALGVAFLLVQAFLWRGVFASGRSTATDAYGTIFYSLTGLHAAHVIGGLVTLAWTSGRARREPAARNTRLALALCSTYWHFMGGVWLVLFAVLHFLD